IARLEAAERENTGIPTLKVGYNKVFGYFIEVPKSRSEKVPFSYVRKQTLVNAERYITEELKEFEVRVLGAEERRAALEYSLFCGVRDRLVEEDERIGRAARFLARVDALLSLAEAADRNDYRRPVVDESGIIEIEDGRHPVVEKTLSGSRFVPNSITLDNTENQVLIITGPNMAGKSTVLRQVALTVLLAQAGSFVPAKSARVGVVDKIFTRVGALDNLAQGQSTFMVEMQETAAILNNATPNSLVILDEIGRGTSTFDGMSIAWAVAEYLHGFSGRGVKTLFATHYHELCALADTLPRVRNHNIAVREADGKIIFLRKLVPGGTNKSYGVSVARLAGVPAEVVKRAGEVLKTVEQKGGAPGENGAGRSRREPCGTQLGLFPTPADKAAKELLSVDLTAITPIEAMNLLYGIQQNLKAGRGKEKEEGLS
ncbi:MAG: DNA mismatch repair protein MutS, partial [Deltaproteobacteria bacterium]|nr:DNA mismatch repair protein MutS [Deltaproteobacteria bacterium]